MLTLIEKNYKSGKLEFFSLGNLPLVNNLTDTFEQSINCDKYPLDLILNFDSGVVSLLHPVNSDLLFYKYLYLSGTSLPFVNHCVSMYEYINKFILLNSDDTIVDIGGNDGTLLKSFKSKSDIKLNYVNIDPSNVIHYSENYIKKINRYFDRISVELVGVKAKIITTTNVFQHLVEIETFVDNIRTLIDEDGIWCLEFPYWYESMKTLQFDQIYHEHVYYYNVTPLQNIFQKYGLRIFNISEHKIHGGSLRMLICKLESHYDSDSSVSEYIENESKIDTNFYVDWKNKVEIHAQMCKDKICELSEKSQIVAFGAAAKGCVFLNYLGLNYNYIDYIIDDTKLKQNKFMPGTGLKIYDRSIISIKRPDYILILAHNFKDYIISSMREFGYTGKFIVCLPEYNIID